MSVRSRPTLCERIRVGDAIVLLGQEHRVAVIEPYDGPHAALGAFALARAADGWHITLFRGVRLEVAA